MRVLHLFSNCKWTGPAEPALSLCCQLRELGVETEFACAPDAGKSVNRVVESARERGMEPILAFHLRKHRHPIWNARDVYRLRRYLADHPFDLVHCHLDNDHEIAARALHRVDLPLVRTSYEGLGLVPNRRRRTMLARTSVLIEPSEIARQHDLAAYGLRPEQVTVVPNAIDTRRFDPERPLRIGVSVIPATGAVDLVIDACGAEGPTVSVIPAQAGIQERERRTPCSSLDSRLRGNDVVDMRAHWNIPPDAYVIGIVARMQTHRHFEDLLQAMRGVVDTLPNARLVIVGRGTHQEKVAHEPVRRLGLEEHVIFTGYIDGDDFVGALKAMDVGVYLVPGSDGTCRAARELMAMGKPLVVADRGMLREIVEDGVSGRVTDGSPEALQAALIEFGRDTGMRSACSRAARACAETRYSLGAQAVQVKALYERILQSRGA